MATSERADVERTRKGSVPPRRSLEAVVDASPQAIEFQPETRGRFTDATIEARLGALAALQEEDGGRPLSGEPPGETARDEWRAKWAVGALAVPRAYGTL